MTRALTNQEIVSVYRTFEEKVLPIWTKQAETMRDAVELFLKFNPQYDPRQPQPTHDA